MDFKKTKSFNFGRTIGIIYAPIVLFVFKMATGAVTVWGPGTDGGNFLFGLVSSVALFIYPILLVILLVLLVSDTEKYRKLDYSDMNILDWIFCALAYIPLLFLLFEIVADIL